MGDIATVISATCAGVGGVIAALALFVRARGESSQAGTLLRRLVDVAQERGWWEHVPAFLRVDIEKHFQEEDE